MRGKDAMLDTLWWWVWILVGVLCWAVYAVMGG